MGIVDLSGRSYESQRREKPVTKAQAGAIITSEIDLAIEGWNKRAAEQNMTQPDKVHLFEIKFERFEYSQEAKEKSGLFGYAKLSIVVSFEEKLTEIYNKGQNFKKESELDNTNAYYPDLVVDCLGFLISSGLMYNLAIHQDTKVKEPKNATKITTKSSKPAAGSKSKPGDGNTGRRSK